MERIVLKEKRVVLCCVWPIVAVLIAWICFARLGQDYLELEDKKFRTILDMHGYKTERMRLETRREEYDLGKSEWRVEI